MRTEKYSRQEIINGWNQEKIANANVCLIGDEILSDMVLMDLLSMGVNNITRIGKSDFFDFEKMGINAYLEQIDVSLLNSEMARIYIPESDYLIDASNDAEQKSMLMKYSSSKGIPFISAAASEDRFSFGSQAKNYSSKKQGKLNSIVCSAMITDELRKKLFSLEYDIPAEEFDYKEINETSHSLKGKKLALIGAGAAGTFAGLGLAFENAEVDIIDFDAIEESNLSRQVLFYEAIGEDKAKVLAERLQKYGGKFKGLVQKVDSNFNLSPYDGVISCVDNFTTRLVLNNLARKYNIPLVNCGVSIYEGEVHGYIPGKTACLDCQMLGALRKEESSNTEKKKGGCIVQPSLIMPNQIAGGLVVEELNKIFRGNPQIIRFSSGEDIFSEEPKIKCLEDCCTK
jgi:molybdopterin/thiamine biosynthesis adenylyltransferase